MRSIAVFVGGVLLVFVFSTGLTEIIFPNEPQLMNKALMAPVNSPVRYQAWQDFHRAMGLITYVINPLVGLAVGIFVGLLQKKYAAIMAIACLIPDWLVGFLGDHARIWTHSKAGIVHYFLIVTSPFVIASVCSWVIAKCRVHSWFVLHSNQKKA